MMWGFFKKTFIADNLAPIVDAAFSSNDPVGGVTLLGVYAFTFQIYCDFSGYTDIARGVAKLMGFEFTLNFNLPYVALNPSDFWRRWHISLSAWLRDYLYKSLGGNRDGEMKTYRNLMVTMLLGGLWHGAAWNFVLWGFYHGAILCAHRFVQPLLRRVHASFGSVAWLWVGLCWLAMFTMTCYGWLLFRARSMEQVLNMTGSLAQPMAGIDWNTMGRVTAIIAPLLLVQFIQWRTGKLFFTNQAWIPLPIRVVIYTLMLYAMLFLGGQPASFVYFQF
jgi:D-alanyl-lipoteichoic acid acyltransferase DltB (MBOAT superfamily)